MKLAINLCRLREIGISFLLLILLVYGIFFNSIKNSRCTGNNFTEEKESIMCLDCSFAKRLTCAPRNDSRVIPQKSLNNDHKGLMIGRSTYLFHDASPTLE